MFTCHCKYSTLFHLSIYTLVLVFVSSVWNHISLFSLTPTLCLTRIHAVDQCFNFLSLNPIGLQNLCLQLQTGVVPCPSHPLVNHSRIVPNCLEKTQTWHKWRIYEAMGGAWSTNAGNSEILLVGIVTRGQSELRLERADVLSRASLDAQLGAMQLPLCVESQELHSNLLPWSRPLVWLLTMQCIRKILMER